MAILALRIRSKRRATAPVHWALIVACVLGVHVAVLALRVGAPLGDALENAGLLLQLSADDEPVGAGSSDTAKRPAEFLKTLSPAEVIESVAPPAVKVEARPASSATQRAESFHRQSIAIENFAETKRGEVSFHSDDLPLSADPLAPQTSSAPVGGELTGFATGGNGESGKGSFAKVLNAMARPKPREALRLPGRPANPRACREGLCRNGVPCEGTSEWQITVSAAGGAPTKIECLKKMDCELQNASIRKFFSEVKFEPRQEESIYTFPVKMGAQQ